MIFLDHIGIVGSSINKLRREWLGRGFLVTEAEELMALDPATGQRSRSGSVVVTSFLNMATSN